AATVALAKGKWRLRRSGTAEAILAQAQDFTDAWVEVVLQPDTESLRRSPETAAGQTADLVAQVRALPGVIALRFDDSQTMPWREGDPETHRIPEAQSRHRDERPGERPATELFSDYYKRKRKADPDPELLALFDRLYQEVSTAADEPQ